MKIVKRIALGALTAVSGVLIACAYGMSYSWRGQVRDSSTQQPIPGIQVGCVHNGQEVANTTTDTDGYYSMSESLDCDELTFTDVDGADNGQYDATSIDNPVLEDSNNASLTPSAS